jgi:uncharacterized membrane protein
MPASLVDKHAISAAQYTLSPKTTRFIFASILVWIFLIIAAPVLQMSADPFLKNISFYLYLFFKPTCHQLTSRSFHIGNHALAVCIRCFAFYLSGLAITFVYLFRSRIMMYRPGIYLLLCSPLLIDFVLEKLNFYSNLYYIRFVTGFIAGLALFQLLLLAVSKKGDLH